MSAEATFLQARRKQLDDEVLTPFPARHAVLAVVGSTYFAKHQTGQLNWVYAAIGFAIGSVRPEVVISGGAIGVDSMAETVAGRFGYLRDMRFRVYLPQRNASGQFTWEDSYQPRNEQIAQNCTHLVSVRHAASDTYGSGWTADRAEELGKLVWRVTLPWEASSWPWPPW